MTFQSPRGPWAQPTRLQLSPFVWRLILLAAALILGLLIASGESSRWDLILRFLYQAPYGRSDPLFGRDIGFYLFSLPFSVAVKNWLFWLLALSAVMAGALYFAHGDVSLDPPPWSVSPAAIAHGSALLGLFFVVKAWAYALDRYLLLYDDNGVVVGAGYTDVHVELPALWLLIVLAAVAAIAAFANIRLRSAPLVIAAALLVFGGAFVFGEADPRAGSALLCQAKRAAAGERPIFSKHRSHAGSLQPRPDHGEAIPGGTGSHLSVAARRTAATVDNIRLWDWRPLLAAYAQLQEIRTYYRFLDVDVDRYHLGTSYQQVMISARELIPSLLPANAQTWVNQHLLFTHGDGAVMSPVTRKSAEGLPIFYLKDIPPVAEGGPPITEPRIYFGQGAAGYVIVKGADAGVRLSKGAGERLHDLRRRGRRSDRRDRLAILVRLDFDDVNILLSGYIAGESRILLHRDIQDRVRTIAPFLQLDRDPYLVISEGRLFWIQDAYTVSDWFPYAKPEPQGRRHQLHSQFREDRHRRLQRDGRLLCGGRGRSDRRDLSPDLPLAVPAARCDAAGSADSTSAIPKTSSPFRPSSTARSTWSAPEVFYNREDLWQFPREPTAPDEIEAGGETARMAPYYIMMRLPGEAQTEFFLMLPMTPSRRENMIAWLAARCDPPEYGKLIVYEFPKDKLIYGPFQIEALINQNTEISQQISLWNQMGSRVIRGNLLVVPIGNSILYVSPLYLRAQSGQLPELKRVIAAYGDRVVMEETLPAALAALFRETAPIAGLPTGAGPSPSGPSG